MDVGYDSLAIADAIERQIAHGRYEPDHLYGDGNSASRIAALMADVDVPIQKTLHY